MNLDSRARSSGQGRVRVFCLRVTAAAVLVAAGALATRCAQQRTRREAPPERSSLTNAAARPAQVKLDAYWSTPLPPRNPTPKTILWEAEKPLATDFPEVNPFAPANASESAKLSGGQWIGVAEPKGKLFLEYDVQVDAPATYQFFVRKFWKHGPFRWRFGDAPYAHCGPNPMLLDSVGLRRFVGVNWVALGEVVLPAGKHRLRVELTEPGTPAAFDAFLLVQGNYIPAGLGPEPSSAPRDPEWVSVARGGDSVSESLLDLRFLNDQNRRRFEPLRTSGGRIVRAADGATERLFGVNIGPDFLSLPDSLMVRHARWLAARGVNLVRFHGPLFLTSDISQLDRKKTDALLRLHAALKGEGIYLGLSIYFPAWLQLKDDPRFPSYTGQSPFGLAFFRREFAAILAGWWESLLSQSRAGDRLRLAEDPSIAFIELTNEDSTLFWTMSPYAGLPPAETEELERQFGSFLAKKHGSIAQALQIWHAGAERGDVADAARVGVMSLYDIAHRRDLRARDTAEFLTRLMRDYYRTQLDALRTHGYRGLTICSNWRTADARYLDPLDKWANGVCDVMDHHGYYQGPHQGDAASYSVEAGQRYDDRSALKLESMSDAKDVSEQPPPIAGLRLRDKPQAVSEIGWPWPNRFRAESAAITVGYGSLLGSDAIVFFADSHPEWAPTLDKFTINDPSILGQFPAAAFAFRRGLIAEGRVQVALSRTEAELFALKGLPLAVPRSYDGLRLRDLPLAKLLSKRDADEMDPLAYLVGPVELGFGNGEPTRIDSFAGLIDRERRLVTSNTRELRLDYGRGLFTIDAAAVNAATGFFRDAGSVSLGAADFLLDIDYGSIFLVALDGRNLSESERILLQVVTETTNTGFEAQGAGLRPIQSVGRAPIVMRRVSGTVWLKRKDADDIRVTALDSEGRPLALGRGGGAEIPLLPDVHYYLIETQKAR